MTTRWPASDYETWAATCDTLHAHAPDGGGASVVALDLHTHEALVEHSDGRKRRIALRDDRPVGEVTRDVLAAARELAGPVEIDPTPQQVSWTVPLDEDDVRATYDPDQVAAYFAVATQAALVLAAFRAPYRGRSTPVNAWWGSFDLAVSWWPGDDRYGKAAFYAYAHPAPDTFPVAALAPAAARWAFQHACVVCDWDPALPASAAGRPPPVA